MGRVGSNGFDRVEPLQDGVQLKVERCHDRLNGDLLIVVDQANGIDLLALHVFRDRFGIRCGQVATSSGLIQQVQVDRVQVNFSLARFGVFFFEFANVLDHVDFVNEQEIGTREREQRITHVTPPKYGGSDTGTRGC